MAIFVVSKLDSLLSRELVKLDVPEGLVPTASVDSLYELVASKFNLGDRPFELISFGRSLQRNKSLACYGIKNGSVLYVFNQRTFGADKAVKEPSQMSQMNQADITRMSTVCLDCYKY